MTKKVVEKSQITARGSFKKTNFASIHLIRAAAWTSFSYLSNAHGSSIEELYSQYLK